MAELTGAIPKSSETKTRISSLPSAAERIALVEGILAEGAAQVRAAGLQARHMARVEFLLASIALDTFHHRLES